MALTNKLSAIGDAIREKTGGTEKLTLDGMVTAIEGIETSGSGGGYDIPDEALVFSGVCDYRFNDGCWDWFVIEFGDKITTEDITSAYSMFHTTSLTSIPFKINFKDTTGIDCEHMFNNSAITEAPLFNVPNAHKIKLSFLLTNCHYLRDASGLFENEEEFGASFQSYVNTGLYNISLSHLFAHCYSLRTVPSWFYLFKLNSESTVYIGKFDSLYSNTFGSCFTLDEIKNVPVWKCQGAMTSNVFDSFIKNCSRLKNLTFETDENNAPIVTEWKSQVIDLSYGVGHTKVASHEDYITGYNSSLTTDTQITDANSYAALKDNVDSWTLLSAYSRYNHDSAVNTINSLPDTSAYLAANGGTNTITFLGEAGSLTDGGAINTLTESEIAVATAKGWTVSFV